MIDAMEKQLGELLYEDLDYTNNDNDNVKLRVLRKGKLTMVGMKEYIRITIPLSIWANVRWIACDICPEVSKSTDFETDVSFVIRITINNSWEVKTESTPMGFDIKKDPYISVGPLNLNIRKLVEKVMDKNLVKVSQEIDQNVKNNVKIRPAVEQAWLKLQEPIQADPKHQAWLWFEPLEFIMAPLQANPNGITIQSALMSYINVVLGNQPQITRKKLPGLTLKESVPRQFNVELPVDVEFAQATEEARAVFKDSVFSVGKKKVKVDDIEVYGKNGEIYVKLKLSEAVKGIVYFSGKPQYDPSSGEIRLIGFDYDIETQKVLVKVAAWLLKSPIRKKVERELVFNAKPYLDEASITLQNYLSGYRYDNILTVNGKLGNLQLKGISSDDKAIKAVFSADGTAEVKILNLSR
jgi:hypothetical protein